MPTTQTWKFQCGHQFFHIKHQANETVTPSGISSLNMPEALIDSPDPCPECAENNRVAQEKKEKARQECKEALIAHKAHSKFLNTQVTSAKNNPNLKEVFKKLWRDSKELWAAKVQELAAEYEGVDGPREAHNIAFERSLEDTEDMIDLMATAAWSKVIDSDGDAIPGPPEALQQRYKEWNCLQEEYKELRKVYEEKIMQGFEDEATKLEEIRGKAVALIKEAQSRSVDFSWLCISEHITGLCNKQNSSFLELMHTSSRYAYFCFFAVHF